MVDRTAPQKQDKFVVCVKTDLAISTILILIMELDGIFKKKQKKQRPMSLSRNDDLVSQDNLQAMLQAVSCRNYILLTTL